MGNEIFSLYDLAQLVLLMVTCYACWKAGIRKGIEDTLDYFEGQGIIKSEENEN